MTRKLSCILFAFELIGFNLLAQHDVHLHVNPKWEQCSFQLDSSLTQQAWHKFTREAGLVSYFRPISGAKPIGKGKVELSLLRWDSKIDDCSDAWNNTFVHPDSTHWLKSGPRLPIPGVSVRVGINECIETGIYYTKSPGANYSIIGSQLQYNFKSLSKKKIFAASRISFSSLFGPDDLNLTIAGLDIIAGKSFGLLHDKISIEPYLLASMYCSHTKEKSKIVDLKNETVFGSQFAIGTMLQCGFIRLGCEYNFAAISTFSFKVGFAFGVIKKK